MNKPSVDECAQGFERILDRINPQQMMMLRAHYHSGGRAATMRELATAAGYADYKMANLQYGNLAKRLYQAMGYPKPKSPRSGNEYWILGLGEFVDRGDFGLEMQCVMRPEVAEALERLEIVEKTEIPISDEFDNAEEIEESEVPNAAYAWDIDNLSETLQPASEWVGGDYVQDFIVYHNPDAMGPLEPNDDFGVVTNRGLGSATIGDRVWLITGEGTPRKYFLASWFYIDEFSSGVEDGFKHAIVGKNGQNFDPFAEIEQDEWFNQLKQDQGNFAFGFSRINTPGAVEGLKHIAGFDDRYMHIPNPAGKVDPINEKTARAIDKIVQWIPAIERAVGQSAENDLNETLAGLLSDLDAADLSLKDPDSTWLTYAFVYATGHTELPEGDLQALRAALTWHTARLPGDIEYWREIAMNGQLLSLLRGFEDYLKFHKDNGLLNDPGASGISPGGDEEFARSDLARWRETVDLFYSNIREEVERKDNADPLFNPGALVSHLSKMFVFLRTDHFLIDIDLEKWAADAKRLYENPDEISEANLLTLRSLLSYWELTDDHIGSTHFVNLTRNGHIVAVLHRLRELLRAASNKQQAKDAREEDDPAACIAIEARPGPIETEAQEQFIEDFEKEWQEVMAKRGDHYLLYWQERSVLDHAANEVPLDVVASNGLFGVEQGDTLWIVTLTQERELFLAGRLVVGEIVEHEEAIRRMPDAGLWQAEYYAFPEPGTEEFIRPLPLTEIAEELRFDDVNDRLTIRDGQINPQQLRKRRKLTPESAELVTSTWEESADITDPEELVQAWQQIVETNPDDPQAHYNLAVALDEVGRSEDAIRVYQETIRLDPNYFPALYNLGNYFVHSGQFDEAIEMFNRAILVDGDVAPVHFMLGVAYFESGRFHDAIAATRQGLEVDPDDEAAYYNIAYWTFRHGDHREALALCDDVIARFPFFTSPHVLKGMCFRELGELDNEIQAYKDAVNIKVDGEGAFIINFTALFFLGAAWERKINGSDEGIEYVEADNHFDLQDAKHQFCFAMGHLAQGDREPADQTIEDLRVSAPDLALRLEMALNHTNQNTSWNEIPDTFRSGDQMTNAASGRVGNAWPDSMGEILVQSCITSVGFPDDLDAVVGMAEKYSQSEWITDTDVLSNVEHYFPDGTFWTAPKWMTFGDVLFFYHTKRGALCTKRLSNEARRISDISPDFLEMMERSRNFSERYIGSIFACAKVDGIPEYFEQEAGAHFRSRSFAPIKRVHFFENPLFIDNFSDQIKIGQQTLTPIFRDQFDRLKELLSLNNALPSFLENAVFSDLSFRNIDRSNWMSISCKSDVRFVSEAQYREYFLDYLLEETKDPRTRILKECACKRNGSSTGIADYFIEINGSWIPVEAKLNILSERDLFGQLEKYVEIDEFSPTMGNRNQGTFAIPRSRLCILADVAGLYLVKDGAFWNCDFRSPLWRREQVNSSTFGAIRTAINSMIYE